MVATRASGCAFNYVVTAHKPTNVSLSVVGNFTSPDEINLIVSKCTRIEIHTLRPEGLRGVLDVPIYGRVAVLELFRPPLANKDFLFVQTERNNFCVLAYDTSSGELITKANGDTSDRVGRPIDDGQIGVIDPSNRMIGLHMYEGLFKVIPVDDRGQLHEAFNIRVEELKVKDVKFLAGFSRPTVGLLYEDTKNARHFKAYSVSAKDKDFVDEKWQQSNLDAGAHMMVAVPHPRAGVLIIGESVIAYLRKDHPMRCTAIKQTNILAVGRIDEDGSRYLMGDYLGQLYLLALLHDDVSVLSLQLELLGSITPPASLSYLDNGVVFIGSTCGDSQLVRIHSQPLTEAEPDNMVEVLDTYTNLGPIVDFAVVDLERQGQGQVITCSGVGSQGSLRTVRNGIGMIEHSAIDMPGIRGMWALRASFQDQHDTYLVLSFVKDTRVLAISSEDELGEVEMEGFLSDAQTLLCGNVVPDQIVQVTSSAVRLLSASGEQLLHEWKSPAGLHINLASASPSQVLVATGEGNVVLLQAAEGQLHQAAHVKLDAEIACLDITPLTEGSQEASVAAVGTWRQQLHLYTLPDMKPVTQEALGGEVIPRSVMFASFEGIPYLLCGLGDGHLYNWHVDASTGQLSQRKKLSLGTQPITLRKLHDASASHVFAASDRPTIIHSANRKLLYSNLNESNVGYVTSFNSTSFPGALALAKEGVMMIGNMDEIQKLQLRTIPLGEQPRRITHQEPSRTFAVLCEASPYATGMEAGLDAVRLLDDQTYETIHRHELDTDERGTALASMSFGDDPAVYYVLGTAYELPSEPEPTRGRIIVLQVRDRRLHQVCDKELRGAVWNVNAFQGKLLAGVHSRVQLFRWAARGEGHELQLECSHSGHIMVLYIAVRGDFILVGDLMKSMALLLYKAAETALELRARDFSANWMTAVEMLDDDIYLGAENSYNLLTVRKNNDDALDDDRHRLEVLGAYHVGEFINRFRHGSLVMKLPDTDAAQIPTVLFGTVNGALGVIASLPQEQYDYLSRLQDCLRKVVKGVGGLDHANWRAFGNSQKVLPAAHFIDGDLVEQLLELPREAQDSVAASLGSDTSTEELVRTVEELGRALH